MGNTNIWMVLGTKHFDRRRPGKDLNLSRVEGLGLWFPLLFGAWSMGHRARVVGLRIY